MNEQPLDVVVIGAGAAGLGAAGELARRGIQAEVLERADAIGTSWQGRYEGLRLNTARWMSALPGGSIPRSAGRWPSRQRFARHLEDFAAAKGIVPRFGVEVRRIDRSGHGWLLQTSAGEIEARSVVVATGYDRVPKIPAWPGRDGYERPLIHSSEYRDPAPYRGRDVLVVGTGNTGTEIATQLSSGGAARVLLSMRTPVNLVPPQILGIPITVFARFNESGPDAVVDRGGRLMQRLTIGDLSRFGMPSAPYGIATEMKVKGMGAVIDRGFVSALRDGELELVAAVERLDGRRVRLVDGSEIEPDAVIAATGYRQGLEPLVGHLGVLDERGRPRAAPGHAPDGAPGLYFNGFWLPFSGQLPAMRRTSRWIAKRVVRRLRHQVAATSGRPSLVATGFALRSQTRRPGSR
jgi:putative flavoprotein involved in K+ transport